eukprot:189083_1
MSSLLSVGLNGDLNISISLHGITDIEIYLLKQCKRYLDDDIFASSRTKNHPNIQNALHCAKRLLSLNQQNAEYHYLYGNIFHHTPGRRGWRIIHSKITTIAHKHYLTSHRFNINHPIYSLSLLEILLSPHFTDRRYLQELKITNYYNMIMDNAFGCIHYNKLEMKLSDPEYRYKHKDIIDQVDCQFIYLYLRFLPKRDMNYFVLDAYFEKYCTILRQ